MVDDSIAITLAHELGLRCGQAAAVAAIDGRRDEEMDLEVICYEFMSLFYSCLSLGDCR